MVSQISLGDTLKYKEGLFVRTTPARGAAKMAVLGELKTPPPI